MAETLSERLAEANIIMGEFNRRVSNACADMNDYVIEQRRLIAGSRELIAKINKILERDRFLGMNGKAEPDGTN